MNKSQPTNTKKKKVTIKPEMAYKTGKDGLTFWTTDIRLFYRIKKILGIK